MLKPVYIVCLLLSNFHPSISDDDKSMEEPEDHKDSDMNGSGVSNSASDCSEPLSNPKINSSSKEVTIGGNVTLECYSEKGSLPINYTIFREKARMIATTFVNKEKTAAVFHFTVKKLCGYKCKAVNRCPNSTRYSAFFNFTSRGQNERGETGRGAQNSLAMLVVLPLLLLGVLSVAILLLMPSWCKAKKLKSTSSPTGSTPTSYPTSENYAIYNEIADENNEEVAYTDVEFNTKNKDYRSVHFKEDTTVNYAEVVIRR